MKRRIIALGLSAVLLNGTAEARGLPQLRIDQTPSAGVVHVEQGVTYVSLRSVAQSLDDEAEVRWSKGRATVSGDGIQLSAVPGEQWLTVNERYLYIPNAVQLREGRTLVPIRTLAQAFGAEVQWEAESNTIQVRTSQEPPDANYDETDLYWLSRIISAESQGESLEGQIAVGNVVLNRVADAEFPDTIYDVIFDDRWGGQFEPVRNGTVYQEPTTQSIIAAKLCLEGADIAGKSLYFLDPIKAGNLWTVYNRPYHMSIGVHDFYL